MNDLVIGQPPRHGKRLATATITALMRLWGWNVTLVTYTRAPEDDVTLVPDP